MMPTLNAEQLAALEQAAHWYTRLNSEVAGPADHDAWKTWLEAEPRHVWAWQQAERLQQQLHKMPVTLASRALELAGHERNASRRGVLKGFALLLGGSAIGWGGYRQVRQGSWLADYRSGVGERLPVTLADGTRLLLNTDSAVDVHYDATQRLLLLRQGEIMVTTATDGNDRPFNVQTPQGLVRALGTRFSVRLDDERARVAVFEHQVRITPSHGEPALLGAGEQCAFDTRGLLARQGLESTQGAWSKGLLIANDQRLGDFIAELGRYRRGWLRCDPQVAALRISGTFNLDDTEQILRAVASALPVRIEARTDYWVTIQPI